jgi:hypothetical protein
MFTLYRIFRAALTAMVLVVAGWLVVMFLVDLAGDAFFNQMPEAVEDTFDTLASIETISGFWPIFMLAAGLIAGSWFESFTLRLLNARRSRSRQVPLAIVYDPDDYRFVHREFPNAQLKPVTRFKIGICNGSGNRPLYDVVVSTNRSAFAKSMLEPTWGGRTLHIERIDPNVIEFVDIVGLADDAGSSNTNARGKAQRFVIRASAKATRRTSAKFEFNSRATPAIRRVS